MLSPALDCLRTRHCTSTHPINTVEKFTDDTTAVGLISSGNETAYRDKVCKLTDFCAVNNLSYLGQQEEHLPLRVRREEQERVASFQNKDLRWSANSTALLKKARQRLFFLRTLRRTNHSAKILESLYHCSVESIPARYGDCSAADRGALQTLVNTAQKISGLHLPPQRRHVEVWLPQQSLLRTELTPFTTCLHCSHLKDATGP